MIRTARTGLLGKNYCNFPIVTRILAVPKQIFVEFSIVPDKGEPIPKTRKSEEVSCQPKAPKNRSKLFHESYTEIKYAFLRDIFSNGSAGKSTLSKRETALKDFYNNLNSFSPSEIVKILKLWSETNNRPIVSLKTLCDVLSTQTKWNYTVDDCSDILYSLGKLSYRDEAVIKLIVEQLKNVDGNKKGIITPSTAAYIMFSLGNLRYRDCELLDKLLTFVINGKPTTRALLNSIKAVCFVNYTSPEVDNIIQTLGKLNEIDYAQSADYINFIWSCIVLNKQDLIDTQHLEALLSEVYISRILNNVANITIKLKLLNINGAAQQMKSYSGPLLNTQHSYGALSASLKTKRTSFMESVCDVLNHIVPQNGLVKPLVNTGAGFYLDFEYCEDVKKSVQAGKFGKMGLMLLNYNDICSDGTLSGMAEFKLNILKGMGYKVITLKYSEYNHSDALSQKIELLRSKIASAAAEKP